MKVEIEKVRHVGTCNYCDGVLDKNGKTRVYDYTEVFVITGKGIRTKHCKTCMDELTGIVTSITNKR